MPEMKMQENGDVRDGRILESSDQIDVTEGRNLETDVEIPIIDQEDTTTPVTENEADVDIVELNELDEEQSSSPTTTIANIAQEVTSQIVDTLPQAQDSIESTTTEMTTSSSTEAPTTTISDVPRYKRKTYKSVGYSWYREG